MTASLLFYVSVIMLDDWTKIIGDRRRPSRGKNPSEAFVSAPSGNPFA